MCDTMVAVHAATTSNEVIFGKNSDRECDEAQYLTVMPGARHEPGTGVRLTYTTIEQVPETYAVLLSKPHWIWGAEIGANEHGLVIGNEALFARVEASADGGIIGMDYLRLALERAGSVDEAVAVMTALLRKHGQSGNCGFRQSLAYHNSFILADGSGATVLETVGREWVVKRVDRHCAISNAMSIGADFESASEALVRKSMEEGLYRKGEPFSFRATFGDRNRERSGRFRERRANALLGERAGALEVSDFFRILRDHQEGEPLPGRTTGPRLCAHTQENPLGQTTASWVSSIASGKAVHWVTGTAAPCTGVFKPVVLEAGLPGHGAMPGPHPDFRSLWWSHERLRNLLEHADRESREAFYGARDTIERNFLGAMGSCPAVTGMENMGEVRQITEACWRDALQFEDYWYERLCADTGR